VLELAPRGHEVALLRAAAPLTRQHARPRLRSSARDARAASRDLSLARLTSLVNDILDVARIEHGAFDIDPRPHDLTALVREIVDTLSTPRQPVACFASENIVAVFDAARIRQCIENLIGNAIKHSPRNATVNVTLSRVVKDDVELAAVDVVDEGPGVSADVVPRLFQRFATGDNRKGLGIGLFLARPDRHPSRGRPHARIEARRGRTLPAHAPDRVIGWRVRARPSRARVAIRCAGSLRAGAFAIRRAG